MKTTTKVLIGVGSVIAAGGIGYGIYYMVKKGKETGETPSMPEPTPEPTTEPVPPPPTEVKTGKTLTTPAGIIFEYKATWVDGKSFLVWKNSLMQGVNPQTGDILKAKIGSPRG